MQSFLYLYNSFSFLRNSIYIKIRPKRYCVSVLKVGCSLLSLMRFRSFPSGMQVSHEGCTVGLAQSPTCLVRTHWMPGATNLSQTKPSIQTWKSDPCQVLRVVYDSPTIPIPPQSWHATPCPLTRTVKLGPCGCTGQRVLLSALHCMGTAVLTTLHAVFCSISYQVQWAKWWEMFLSQYFFCGT